MFSLNRRIKIQSNRGERVIIATKLMKSQHPNRTGPLASRRQTTTPPKNPLEGSTEGINRNSSHNNPASKTVTKTTEARAEASGRQKQGE